MRCPKCGMEEDRDVIAAGKPPPQVQQYREMCLLHPFSGERLPMK
ncbi:MAG: hypothetical protein QW261_00005 [Candidatus Jordarchaeaceae archaeon]